MELPPHPTPKAKYLTCPPGGAYVCIFLLLVSLHEIKGNSHLLEQLSDIDHSHFPLLTFRRMTSYKLVAIRNKPRALDLNENGIRLQPDVFTYKETSLSDDEDRRDSEKSSGLHGRSQSLKNLNKREEPGPISRSKSLREMDSEIGRAHV